MAEEKTTEMVGDHEEAPVDLSLQLSEEGKHMQGFNSGVSAAPEASSLRSRFLRQYISPGEAVYVTTQPKGVGPWAEAPIQQHVFQSSQRNVRITITPRQGKAIQYACISCEGGRYIHQFRGTEQQ